MSGWWKLSNGSALDCLKVLQKLQKSELCFYLEQGSEGFVNGAEEDKLRCLFEQLLCIFLKEICGSDCFRHLPPMLGDGQSVDLFKLYFVVRKKGGCEMVSRNGLWDSVTEELGLSRGVGSAVKLIYVKYLDTLERWLQKNVKDKDPKCSLQDSSRDLIGCLSDSEPEIIENFSQTLDHQKNDKEYPHLDSEMNNLYRTDFRGLWNVIEISSSVESDEDRKSVLDTKNEYNDKDDVISDANFVAEEEVSTRKRKRVCYQRMLNWVIEVAKNPCNPEVGSLPDRSNWKSYGIEQLWKQILLVREASFLTRNAGQSNSIWLIKQKMHPSMYDDHTGSDSLRCSQRLLSAKESQALSSKKSCARASSESSSGTQRDLKDQFNKESNPMSADSVVDLFGDDYVRKPVPVGPLFQADVPEWTGETCGSDCRWLGSQIWPLESRKHKKYIIERDRIRKGRQDQCGCQHPGSVECIEFHIAENRMKLKLELGLAFYLWKFDKMGEEVALSWTQEEEKRFQTIIRSNPPSLDKCFWDEMFKSFPTKNREDLVSYYFNVVLLRRRGCQNRSTPKDVDSDDEESEFALLRNRFGHGAAKSPGSIFHSPKKRHLNFR